MNNEDFVCNAPVAPTEETEKTKASNRRKFGHFYQMRPVGQSNVPEDNNLLIPGFRPALFKQFKFVIPPTYLVWNLRIPGHYVETHLPGGNTFSSFVLCKKESNAEYENSYKNPLVLTPMTCSTCNTVSTFRACLTCGNDLGVRPKDSSCPQCDWASRQWAAWRAEWAALGFTNSQRTALKQTNKDLYNQYLAPGTALRGFQDDAAANMPTDRYLMVVLDVDKLLGRRPLAEDEPADVTLQLSFQGKSVFDLLQKKHRANKIFHDARNKMAIVLTRDTHEGVRYTKYSVEDSIVPEIPDEWVAYIGSQAGMPDLSADDLVVLSYEEHSSRAGLTMTQEDLSPVLTSPPIAAPARQVPPPPVLTSAPVAPPVMPPAPGPVATPVMPPPAVVAPPPAFSPPTPTAAPLPVVAPPPVFSPPVPPSPPLPPVGGGMLPMQQPIMEPPVVAQPSPMTPPPPATPPVIPGRVGMPTASAAPAPLPTSQISPPPPPNGEGQRPRRQW